MVTRNEFVMFHWTFIFKSGFKSEAGPGFLVQSTMIQGQRFAFIFTKKGKPPPPKIKLKYGISFPTTLQDSLM